MSTSEQEAIEELKRSLEDCLKDRRSCMTEQGFLNFNLVDDLKGLVILQLPQDYRQSLFFFAVFFESISHLQVTSRYYPNQPVLFRNIFMAIKKFKVRIRVFMSILLKTCQKDFHYEALFAVMCDVLRNPDCIKSQNEKLFLLKCMILLRIKQRSQFPPKPDISLNYLCLESFDEIIEMINKKHGMKDRSEAKDSMTKRLNFALNQFWNDQYSRKIKKILESEPIFFEEWEPELKRFFSTSIQNGRKVTPVRSKEKEKSWLPLLEGLCPKFWVALLKHQIDGDTKSWILYWYVRHMQTRIISSSKKETFNELMTGLVQPGQMSFPFSNPPKLFKNDDGDFLDLSFRWGVVPRSDLLEIFSNAHGNEK